MVGKSVRRRPLIAAVAVAAALRLGACAIDYRHPDGGLEHSYLKTAASLASGRGALMGSVVSAESGDVAAYMKEREAAGGRVDRDHPFPKDTEGWLPATGHPPGYSLLLYLLYQATNYSGMIALVHLIQALLDAMACLLVYVFVRNLFGAGAALIGAWMYALLPAPISLTLQILPDALSCFFAAAILALATSALKGPLAYGAAAGAAIGIAAQFRAEFVLWSLIVILPFALAALRWQARLRFGTAVLACEFVLLLPWAYWTHRVTGHALVTGSVGGGSLYEALGEDPGNPWGVTLLDGWVGADAAKRGFSSPWSPEADVYYRAAFLRSVREHPESFIRLVLTHRVPLALVPPYTARSYTPAQPTPITEIRLREGLSRFGVLWKYPGLVLAHRWDTALMALISALLLAGLIGAAISYRHEWRTVAWVVIPWLFTVCSMSVLKQVEARNVATTLVVQVAASSALLARRRAARPAIDRNASSIPAAV